MSIRPYLTAQLCLHPAMTPQDVAKLCYQAAHGAEHLLSDPERAYRYLLQEWEATAADGRLPLTEPISDDIARVNLAPWKAAGLSSDLLFRLFAATASVSGEEEKRLTRYLAEAEAWAASGQTGISAEAWRDFLARYRAAGMPPIHHSDAYREAEKPAYRIVRRDLLRDAGIVDESTESGRLYKMDSRCLFKSTNEYSRNSE